MELSKKTIDILKNFSTINPNIYIKKGENTITTIAESKAVVAEANVDEVFPVDMGILNLNRMLSITSMFKDPVFEFAKDSVTIHENDNAKQSFRYFYTDPSCLTYPQKKVIMPETPVEFDLSSEIMDQILTASRVSQLPFLKFECSGESVKLHVLDVNNPLSNTYTVEVEASVEKDISPVMSIEKLKIMAGGYRIRLNEKLAHLQNHDREIVYYIAMDVLNRK